MPHQIVEPEPHSTGTRGTGWSYAPRWLRFVLFLIVLAAIALMAHFFC